MVSGELIAKYARYPKVAENVNSYFSLVYSKLKILFPKIRRGSEHTNTWKLTPENYQLLEDRGVLLGKDYVTVHYCDFHVAYDAEIYGELMLTLELACKALEDLNDDVITISIAVTKFMSSKLAT